MPTAITTFKTKSKIAWDHPFSTYAQFLTPNTHICDVNDVVLVSLLLTLNIFLNFFSCFYR